MPTNWREIDRGRHSTVRVRARSPTCLPACLRPANKVSWYRFLSISASVCVCIHECPVDWIARARRAGGDILEHWNPFKHARRLADIEVLFFLFFFFLITATCRENLNSFKMTIFVRLFSNIFPRQTTSMYFSQENLVLRAINVLSPPPQDNQTCKFTKSTVLSSDRSCSKSI